MLRKQLDGAILTLTMDRPEKRNALSPDLVASLTEAFEDAAENSAVRVVVLAGEGSAFSAGADLDALRAMQSASEAENLADSRRLAALFETMYRLPKPVIARIAGAAVAGGCGLAAVCDISLASTDARFGLSEVRIGFVPAIVSVFLARKLGEAALRDLALRGQLIDAHEAARIGLITRAVTPETLENEVRVVAEDIAEETSPTAVAMTKDLLADLHGRPLREALDYAAATNARARGTADCRAGVAAFLEKRDPPWRVRR